MDLQSVLNKKFGYQHFRMGQEAVIRDVVAKNNTIAIFPTGSGKSLCYQLPAYLLEGTVLIISPLVALMEDQVAIMKRNGEKRVVALNSFLTYQERLKIMDQLTTYKFIFISPEMLLQSTVYEKIQRILLAFVVVDEAHCISQWGFDFRPDYLRIGEFLNKLNCTSVLALTATADQGVLQDIIHYLNMDAPLIHKQSLDRPNLSYTICPMNSEEEKTNWIINRIKNTISPGIIYVASRKRADELSVQLNKEVGSVAAYHAGMEQEDRAIIQDQFIQGHIEWICATNAFGMGIHKGDVRQVIHEHVPATVAGYMQEIGRAGRDGKLAATTLLYTPHDIRKTRFIIQEDTPHEEAIRYFGQLLADHVGSVEAARLSGISETGKRVIEYYFERMSIEETVLRMSEQSAEKEKQLQKMIQLIESPLCIRQNLLNFFSETLIVSPPSCCSSCKGLTDEWLYEKQENHTERALMDWREKLIQLLG